MYFPEGSEPYVALAVLGLMFAAFLTERFPPAVVAVSGAIVFLLIGFINTDELMSVFSNTAPLTIAAMFVLSGALVRTGTLEVVANAVIARAETRPVLAVFTLLGGAVVASAFINNTPVVIILIPIVIRLAGAIGRAPSRLLIPLSYAAIMGGTCTLIGTSTNLLVDGVAQQQGLEPFSIFEITPIGIVLVLVGGASLLILGRYLLPDRGGADPLTAGVPPDYLTEITIRDPSPLIGQTIGEAAILNVPGTRVRALKRKTETIRTDLADIQIAAGDRLVIVGPASEVLTLHQEENLTVGATRRPALREGEERMVVEAIVAPGGNAMQRPLGDLALTSRFGVVPLAVHRHRHVAGADLGSARLRPADTVLLDGTGPGLSALAAEGDFVSISETRSRPFRRTKAPVAIAALAGVVMLAAFNVMDIGALAMIAVAVILVTRCIDLDEALQSIDGPVLLLIFAMLAFGIGLQNSGAMTLIIDTLGPLLASAPPFALLLGIYVLTSALTEAITNNAVAVILTPLAIGLAAQAGLDPRPFVIAVMFGASAAFATPIGYQTNTLVYGAGNYRFVDFVKIGLPMNVISAIVTCLAIDWLMM